MRIFLICLCCLGTAAVSDHADAVDVTASQNGETWRVSVSIAHPDTGWDHYADGWRLELADGTVLGTRVLAHPHENEQPFTRSLSGISVPEGTNELYIRTKCSVDGWGAKTQVFVLPK